MMWKGCAPGIPRLLSSNTLWAGCSWVDLHSNWTLRSATDPQSPETGATTLCDWSHDPLWLEPQLSVTGATTLCDWSHDPLWLEPRPSDWSHDPLWLEPRPSVLEPRPSVTGATTLCECEATGPVSVKSQISVSVKPQISVSVKPQISVSVKPQPPVTEAIAPCDWDPSRRTLQSATVPCDWDPSRQVNSTVSYSPLWLGPFTAGELHSQLQTLVTGTLHGRWTLQSATAPCDWDPSRQVNSAVSYRPLWLGPFTGKDSLCCLRTRVQELEEGYDGMDRKLFASVSVERKWSWYLSDWRVCVQYVFGCPLASKIKQLWLMFECLEGVICQETQQTFTSGQHSSREKASRQLHKGKSHVCLLQWRKTGK